MSNEKYIRVVDILPSKEYVYTITKQSCDLLKKEAVQYNQTDKISHFLACADFYFFMKSSVANVEIEKQYIFQHSNTGKRVSFRLDLLIKTSKYYFVEIDLCNKRFDEKVKTWEEFYKSGEYSKYFDKFPPIIIVSTDVSKIQKIIDSTKTINFNYIYKDYKDIATWNYIYKK